MTTAWAGPPPAATTRARMRSCCARSSRARCWPTHKTSRTAPAAWAAAAWVAPAASLWTRGRKRCWACWPAAAASRSGWAAAVCCRGRGWAPPARCPALAPTHPTPACPRRLQPAACRGGPRLWAASPRCSAWPAAGWGPAAAAPLCLAETTATAPCPRRWVGACAGVRGRQPAAASRMHLCLMPCLPACLPPTATQPPPPACPGEQGQRRGRGRRRWLWQRRRGRAHQLCKPAAAGGYAGRQWRGVAAAQARGHHAGQPAQAAGAPGRQRTGRVAAGERRRCGRGCGGGGSAAEWRA